MEQGWSGSARRRVYEGKIATFAWTTFRYDDGEDGRARGRRPPGRGRRGRPRRRDRLPGPPAARGGGEADDCWSCPPASSTSRGSRRSSARKRELAEEIGKEAGEWRELKRFYTSPGFAEEEVSIFLATGLADCRRGADPDERIEVVAWPLADLDGAIDACRDSKSLIGLLLLQRMREASGP